MPDLTLILAIWGAVLSTVLGLLKIFDALKDKPIVKISLQSGYKTIPPDTIYGDMTMLIVRVVNQGRRPISITGCSLMLPRVQNNLFCMDSLTAKYPVELTENKYHDFYMNEDMIKKDYALTPDQYVAFVHDAAGKKYWSHNFILRFWKVGRVR